MTLRSSGNDEMLPISSVNKIDGRFYAILYTEPHIDYSDSQVPALARLWRVYPPLEGPTMGLMWTCLRLPVRCTQTGADTHRRRPRIPGRSFGLSSKPTCGTEGDLCPFSPQNAVRH